MELSPTALQRLGEAARKNWSSIEPSIFGTLCERALDASKRSQLGAHYTGAEDIMLVVEPVVLTPLRREWETAKQEMGEWAGRGRHLTKPASAWTPIASAWHRSRFWIRPAAAATFSTSPLRALLDLETAGH